MSPLYTVYQHKNKINGKVYIGITMQEPEKRWGVNGRNYKSSPHFYSAIQKYGWDNFEHNILFTNLTKEEACLKEIEFIVCRTTRIHSSYIVKSSYPLNQNFIFLWIY